MSQAADIPNKDSTNADLRDLQNHLSIELSGVSGSETVSNERLSTIIDFNDIDLDFYYEFVSYLQRLNLANNTPCEPMPSGNGREQPSFQSIYV